MTIDLIIPAGYPEIGSVADWMLPPKNQPHTRATYQWYVVETDTETDSAYIVWARCWQDAQYYWMRQQEY